MEYRALETGWSDEVKIFDVAEALARRDGVRGRVDMAGSANCYIAVFQVAPRGGETHMHQHPDSDQILFILRGECTVESLSGRYVLRQHQGVLIPAGVNYGFTNTSQEDLLFLSMRTEAVGGRRVGYVPNVPSGVKVRVPEREIGARGIGHHIYVYAMDRQTLGISPLIFEEWNRASLLRMNCQYERDGEYIIADLPERIVRWYRLRDLEEGDYVVQPEPDHARVRVDLTPLVRRQDGMH